jgi:hypothetical protein
MEWRTANTIERLEGQLPVYTSLGFYPLYYLDAKTGDCFCGNCATAEIDAGDIDPAQVYVDVNWEDNALYCENCGARIDPAYDAD